MPVSSALRREAATIWLLTMLLAFGIGYWLARLWPRAPRRCPLPYSRGSTIECSGGADPRCDGGLCAYHCTELCEGRCWRLRPNGTRLAALPGGKGGAA